MKKIIYLALFLLLFNIADIALAKGNNQQRGLQKSLEEIDKSLEYKVGQMILVGFKGLTLEEDEGIIEALEEGKVGSVILFYANKHIRPYNIASESQVRALIKDINKYAKFPVFISLDQEGGYVQRISSRNGFKDYPSAESLGKTSIDNTYASAKDMGETLYDLGFNLNFAPSVDLLDKNSPAIGAIERAFHKDPEVVALYANAFAHGLHDAGLVTSLKHFPGHGSATKDTHLGIADITNTWSDRELIPYKNMLNAGYNGMIMVAHVYHTGFDTKPASLSKVFINDILRGEIGFDGVVISDDMQMNAITDQYSLEDTIFYAIDAGTDILLFGNNLEYGPQLAQKIHAIIMKLIADGRISEERIEESWQRIRKMKETYL